MKKYVNFIAKRRTILIVAFLIINIVSIYGIFQINLNTDFAIFSTSDSKHEQLIEDAEETFGELSQLLVIVEDHEFNDDDIDSLYEIQRYFESFDSITNVQGVAPETITMNVPNVGPQQIEFQDLTSDQIRQYHSSFGSFSALIDDEQIYYQFTLVINEDFSRDDINDIETYLEETSYDTYISGDYYNQNKIIDYISFILMLLPPLALITILFIFRLQIGNMKATLLSVVPAGVGALWTMGLIGLLGNEVSILSAVVPIFVIVIGSADGLHFMSHIQDARSEGYNKLDSISHTLKMVGVPMIVTTLTSMVGFLALLSMNTDSVVDLAVFASVGILFAGIATWYVLPLILVSDITVTSKNKRKDGSVFSDAIKKLWGYPTLVLSSILIILAVIFIPMINNEFNMLMVYKDSTIVAKNASKVEEVSGGSIPFYVVIDVEDIQSYESMLEVTEVHDVLIASDAVQKVTNPYDFLNIIKQNTTQQPITNDQELAQIMQQAEVLNPDFISSVFSVEEQKVRFLIFSTDLENETLSIIEELFEDDEDVYVTGVQYQMKDLNSSINTMQFYSIILALAAVLVMLIISIRSIKIGLISLLPIIVTILGVYAFLGISQIPLNVTTTIIFSITIGVGIDYAVHYSSVYKVYLDEGYSKKDSAEKSFKYTSRPVIANALGISIGLTIMMFSPLQIHFNLSALMWVSMTVSVLMTLSLLPVILQRGK